MSISIPILNAIYPIAIVLILLGITHRVWAKNRYVYPIVVAGTGVVSVLYALDTLHLPLGSSAPSVTRCRCMSTASAG